MAYLNRIRAQSLMQHANLDALILLSPESFYYATGARAGVATMWRKAGAVAVLIPADAADEEMAVVSDLFAPEFYSSSHISDIRISPIWVETTTIESPDHSLNAAKVVADAWRESGRSADFDRPSTFDPSIGFNHIADALSEKGLSGSRVGVEADAMTMAEYTALEKALPNTMLCDASHIVARLKMVKCDEEIHHLRDAVTLAERGITAVQNAIQVGISRNELAEVWLQTIEQHRHNIALTDTWEYISVGTNPWGGNAKIQKHDLIKVDVGCVVNGYTSDTGRTYVMYKSTELQRSLFTALRAGFDAGSALLQPGTKLSHVHNATQTAIRDAGFPAYTRGHFGHGLGAGLGSEQWPFIAADNDVELEPGMVIAFECPWYINGLGGMIVENQVLITQNGHEMMNTLPLDLCEIPAS